MVLTPGGARQIGAPQVFEVKPVPNLPAGLDLTAVATFQAQVADVQRRVAAATAQVRQAREELRYMEAALVATPGADASLAGRLDAARRALADIALRLSGDPVRQRLNEVDEPSIAERVGEAAGTWSTRQLPTSTQRAALESATADFEEAGRALAGLLTGDLARLQRDLAAAGAPYIPGQPPAARE
jgi:hypothetical protein